jgi:hypothetical protein
MAPSRTCRALGSRSSAICRILSLDRKTFQRFARASTVDDMLGKVIARTSGLDSFKSYLHQRWNGGVTEAAQLAKGDHHPGYPGSEQTVRRYEPEETSLSGPDLRGATLTGPRLDGANLARAR